MATADEQIRISDRVKKRLDSRRREGESYNDVLDRLLGETTDSDFEDGFGLLSETDGEWIREQRAKAKDERKERMHGLGDV
ncbi:antitoxin VapB family protein [Halobellus marinus]|uniref:antitoxin VapB family protein n=1 Tax=Halobellus TaxID=1073986 RepID=UPI0028A59F8C|nr:antitoxin VapB family protein [Halobellus sp. DFY28]